jgi:Immunity protein 27
MKIQLTETQITGKWLSRDGRAFGDETCERINELVRSHLKKLGHDTSGWEVLYRDPDDGRLWELTYPQSELHGGGPPQLRCLTLDEARKKYADAVLV